MILTKEKYPRVDLSALVENKITSGKLYSLLIIVPTNRRSRSLKKELIKRAGGKVEGKINIETIGTFSRKLYSSFALTPIQLLSEAAAAVLLKRCFKNSTLKYFNQYKSEVPSGTLSRIKNIISEYKRHGISPEDLLYEAGKLEGSEKLKAEDISRIYTLYNEECKRTASGETGDIYKEIINCSSIVFSESFRSLYENTDLVVVNGFDEFTSPEVSIINLISGVEELKLYISFDYDRRNPGLFKHLQQCYEKFTSLGFNIAQEVTSSEQNLFRKILREEYFNQVHPVQHSAEITEITALNRVGEVELIAKEIREILQSGKTEPDKICVVFNLIQNYSPIIRDKFNLYRIPFNLTDRLPLHSSGPVTSVITLLEIASTDFYYKNVFRALSSGFLSFKHISLSDLMNSASELRIISGYENWVSALQSKIKTVDRNQYIYEKALRSIQHLNSLLNPFNNKMSVPDFRKELFGLLNDLEIPSNILSFPGEPEVYFKGLASFYELITELFNLMITEYGNDKKFSLSFYLDEIRTAAENSRFNIIEKPGYGVQVTNLNEIRGLNFDYLFIGGMIDGELPTRYTPEIFYSGSFQRQEWKHQVEERYRFYQSLCTWEKGLYLTRPLQEETKEFVPSNFISELRSHFSINQKTAKDYSSTVYSYEELEQYAASNIEADDILEELMEFDSGNLKNMMKIYSERSDTLSESIYSGHIYSALDSAAKEVLLKMRSADFSASQLEVYAGCPFRYFLERVLYLKVTEEPEEEIESRDLGTLIHKILYLFYRSIQDENITLFGCSDEDFRKAEKIIFSKANEVLGEVTLSPLNFLEAEKITGLNGDKKNSILYRFLLAERENNGGYKPYDFEVVFGKLKDENQSEPDEFFSGDIKLRGKIDRIDIDEKNNRIRVTDYKLGGKKPELQELYNGLSLQLPLYLYAASEIIKKRMKKEFIPSGADIYSLKYQKKSFGRNPVLSERNFGPEDLAEEYETIIKICRESIEKYVQNIYNGVFNLTKLEDREKKVCGYCNFKYVCRINE